MTPEEKALRDAFLAECWPTVREYDPGKTRRECAQPVDEPVNKRGRGKAS